MEALLLNTLPIVGVIVGAFLQFHFSKNKDNRQLKRALETQAYTDYLRAVAGLSMSHRFNDEEKKREYLSVLTEAKIKISIYGSKEVIESLADFEREGANFNTDKQKTLFIKIGQAMRSTNINSTEKVLDKNFGQLFFSIDLE
ncbi:hypothetical protein G7051_08145 [Dysgonomonas sp. HDW5B]|uniref:hypothetical protein n=1 Tax=Dysgonomonas sp. HDW5B TaxID=2714927 RepID=UPI0014088EDD|nr:hypothetical protein [Dysgonomonas sp. HDW5B]QIK54311.1 hypothetical protein G7051_08145 [Dysgonomonas sp. HDW5B]